MGGIPAHKERARYTPINWWAWMDLRAGFLPLTLDSFHYMGVPSLWQDRGLEIFSTFEVEDLLPPVLYICAVLWVFQNISPSPIYLIIKITWEGIVFLSWLEKWRLRTWGRSQAAQLWFWVSGAFCWVSPLRQAFYSSVSILFTLVLQKSYLQLSFQDLMLTHAFLSRWFAGQWLKP